MKYTFSYKFYCKTKHCLQIENGVVRKNSNLLLTFRLPKDSYKAVSYERTSMLFLPTDSHLKKCWSFSPTSSSNKFSTLSGRDHKGQGRLIMEIISKNPIIISFFSPLLQQSHVLRLYQLKNYSALFSKDIYKCVGCALFNVIKTRTSRWKLMIFVHKIP